MPLVTRPGETFRVRLKKDKERFADRPELCPFFEFRAVSCDEWKRIGAAVDDPRAFATGAHLLDALAALLADYLVGWGNMNGPEGEILFEPSRLLAMVSQSELWELVDLLAGQGVGEDERKNSPSPSA